MVRKSPFSRSSTPQPSCVNGTFVISQSMTFEPVSQWLYGEIGTIPLDLYFLLHRHFPNASIGSTTGYDYWTLEPCGLVVTLKHTEES